jgi:tetratricopeptide (TPR) repeat protein
MLFKMKNIVLFILFAFFISDLVAQTERKVIREGNEFYNKNEFAKAETNYIKALNANENSFEAKYNLGNSLYKQKKYAQADSIFSQIASEFGKYTENEDLSKTDLAKVYHNKGNSLLMQKQYAQSIKAYKEALKRNPNDEKTRYNLAYAQKKLVEQQKQQQQKNEGGDENSENKNDKDKDKDKEKKDDKNNKDNKDKKSEGDNKEEDQDSDGIPDKTEKGNNPSKPRDTDKDGKPDFQDQDADNDDVPDSQEAGENPKNPKDTDKDGVPDYRDTDSDNDGVPDNKEKPVVQGISKEDAKRILEALENDEKDLQKKLKEQNAKKAKVKTEKDW